MRVTIVNDDQMVSVDGEGVNFELNLPDEIHAIQWYEDHGEVEYRDSRPNLEIDSLADYQGLIDAHATKKAERDAPPPPPTEQELALQGILALEAQITDRRMREAVLTGDNSFIQGIEDQIVVLRGQLQ